MAKKKLKIDQLAKLRQFTQGMNVESFLATEFRQIVRALEQASIEFTDLVTSRSSEVFSTSSTSLIDVTNLSISIVTTGRPIFVGLIADGTANEAFISSVAPSSLALSSELHFVRNGTTVSGQKFNNSTGTQYIPVSSFSHIDTPEPGRYIYKVQLVSPDAKAITVNYAKLIAYEI